MKYILTEDELNDLKWQITIAKTERHDLVQELCRLVATHKPVKFWGHKDARTWGCILNEKIESEDEDDFAVDKDGNELQSMGYCDECPVQDICPYKYKKWSK